MRKVVSIFFIKDNPIDIVQVQCENVSYRKWNRQVKDLLTQGYFPIIRVRNIHGVYSCKYSPNHRGLVSIWRLSDD